MSHSPATPNNADVHENLCESKAPLLTTDKLTSAPNVKQISLNEPSPASTYSDTIPGGSSPATPLDVGSHGECTRYFPVCYLPRSIYYPLPRLRSMLGLDDSTCFLEAEEFALRYLL